jgi:ribonuclease HI
VSRKAVLYSDGASAGNPGASGIGAVIEMAGRTYELSEPIGTTTNNIAEYTALLRGLQKARALGAEEITVFADSELLVKQLEGAYKVKNPNLLELHKKVVRLKGAFRKFSLRHITREENKRADALAKKASQAPVRERKEDPPHEQPTLF